MKSPPSWMALLIIASNFSSCSLPRVNLDEVSVLDFEYRMAANRSALSKEEVPPFAAVYKNGLGLLLGTDCRWTPSDSEYGLHKYRECGAFISTVKTFSRYLSEYDAYLISDGVINIEDRLHFVHFDNSCVIF